MISSQTDEDENVDTDFPKIMQSTTSNVVVLFNADGGGTVVASGDSEHEVGKYLKKWKMHKFVQFNERVVLKNQ